MAWCAESGAASAHTGHLGRSRAELGWVLRRLGTVGPRARQWTHRVDHPSAAALPCRRNIWDSVSVLSHVPEPLLWVASTLFSGHGHSHGRSNRDGTWGMAMMAEAMLALALYRQATRNAYHDDTVGTTAHVACMTILTVIAMPRRPRRP